MSIGDQLQARGFKLVSPKKTTKAASSKAPTAKVATKPAMVLASEPEPAPKAKFNFSGLKVPKLGVSGRLIPTATEIRALGEELATFKKDVGPYMHDLVSQLWDAFLAPVEVAVALTEAKASLEASIREVLESQEPYRTPGRIAWADALIKTAPNPFQNRGILTAVIERLEKEKFLTVGVGVGFKHVGKNYVLASDLVVREDAQSVMKSLLQLRERGIETEHQEVRSELEQLQATAGNSLISFAGLMTGKEGFVIIDVPDQNTPDGKFFSGGTILVQSLSGAVRVVDGAGRIRKRALNLNDTGASVTVATLAEEKPVFASGSNWRDQLGIHGLIRRFITQEDDKKRYAEMIAKVDARRAQTVAEAKARFKEQCDQEFALLVAKANLSFDEFFAGNDGVFALRLAMFEQVAGKRVWQVMCLLERRTGDGHIRMIECPERLKEFFGGDVSTPMAPGKRFSNVPNPLGILLRMGLSGFERKKTDDQSVEKAPKAVSTEVVTDSDKEEVAS